MRTHDLVPEAMLKEQGFHFITNFGFSKVWGKVNERVLVDSSDRVITTYNLGSHEPPQENHQNSNGQD